MRKLTLEVIVPDGIELSQMSDCLQYACESFIFTQAQGDGKTLRLRAEIVISTKFDPDKATFVLMPAPKSPPAGDSLV